ncbi:hypothetical protein DICVIV_11163 [Dictyocaulus viviparus]|uniref:G-protein coupled receptors family 1 profile domain-containing protein n=1 Tax=Dictyocaulus viviparus TaxID=29172 RepID=A0A0D8XGJ3_DICVI|nr:hypothetical protein DICVIV_11163 [Dictyocaulus viviparus]
MSNSTEIFSPTAQMENIVVSMIIYVTGILGLLSNGGAIVAVRENFELRNLFRIVYLSRSVSNMGVQLIFLFWNTPTILLRDKTEAEMIDKVLGLMLIILWNVSVYLRLAMSLNRIIAIILPLQASSIFDMKNSFIAVFLCWLFALCHVVPYLLADECLIIFNKATWVWTFLDSTCGHSIPIFTNFYSTIVVLILIFLLDCSTIISLRVKNTSLINVTKYDVMR